jgi:hypothetical protein
MLLEDICMFRRDQEDLKTKEKRTKNQKEELKKRAGNARCGTHWNE